MKITESSLKIEDNIIISIIKAIYIDNFSIKIKFNDYTEKIINFKPFLLNSLHPSIRKYLNEEIFKKFDIIDGNLNWNDYGLIFPISDLYAGKII